MAVGGRGLGKISFMSATHNGKRKNNRTTQQKKLYAMLFNCCNLWLDVLYEVHSKWPDCTKKSGKYSRVFPINICTPLSLALCNADTINFYTILPSCRFSFKFFLKRWGFSVKFLWQNGSLLLNSCYENGTSVQFFFANFRVTVKFFL
jgi:hypothetical protein